MRRAVPLVLLTLLLWLSGPAEGLLRAQQAPRAPQLSFEDPTGEVLPRIRARLLEASTRLVRLSVWGGSHTASDQYTGALRTRLQRRFGAGGTGRFFPTPPMTFYARRDVVYEQARGFVGVHALHATSPMALGIAGMAPEARGDATARFRVPASEGVVRVFVEALGAAEGSVTLEMGEAHETRRVPATERVELTLPLSSRRPTLLTLRASRVRVLGVSIEEARGVVVENFGVSGARAERAQHWESASFDAQLAAAPPDIAMLAYGTNESIGRRPIEDERRALEALITRIRAGAPSMTCLVIGPSNHPLRRGGRWIVNARNALIRNAFRDAALAQGCAFFDLIAFQGGPSNLEEWVREGRVLEDHVHMTDAVHEELAGRLMRAFASPCVGSGNSAVSIPETLRSPKSS